MDSLYELRRPRDALEKGVFKKLPPEAQRFAATMPPHERRKEWLKWLWLANQEQEKRREFPMEEYKQEVAMLEGRPPPAQPMPLVPATPRKQPPPALPSLDGNDPGEAPRYAIARATASGGTEGRIRQTDRARQQRRTAQIRDARQLQTGPATADVLRQAMNMSQSAMQAISWAQAALADETQALLAARQFRSEPTLSIMERDPIESFPPSQADSIRSFTPSQPAVPATRADSIRSFTPPPLQPPSVATSPDIVRNVSTSSWGVGTPLAQRQRAEPTDAPQMPANQLDLGNINVAEWRVDPPPSPSPPPSVAAADDTPPLTAEDIDRILDVFGDLRSERDQLGAERDQMRAAGTQLVNQYQRLEQELAAERRTAQQAAQQLQAFAQHMESVQAGYTSHIQALQQQVAQEREEGVRRAKAELQQEFASRFEKTTKMQEEQMRAHYEAAAQKASEAAAQKASETVQAAMKQGKAGIDAELVRQREQLERVVKDRDRLVQEKAQLEQNARTAVDAALRAEQQKHQLAMTDLQKRFNAVNQQLLQHQQGAPAIADLQRQLQHTQAQLAQQQQQYANLQRQLQHAQAQLAQQQQQPQPPQAPQAPQQQPPPQAQQPQQAPAQQAQGGQQQQMQANAQQQGFQPRMNLYGKPVDPDRIGHQKPSAAQEQQRSFKKSAFLETFTGGWKPEGPTHSASQEMSRSGGFNLGAPGQHGSGWSISGSGTSGWGPTK